MYAGPRYTPEIILPLPVVFLAVIFVGIPSDPLRPSCQTNLALAHYNLNQPVCTILPKTFVNTILTK